MDVVKVDEDLKAVPGSDFSLECDTILISVGLISENELLDASGIEAGNISIPGLFVCGNALKIYDLADSVTKDAVLAGKQAAEYLKGLG